MPPPVVVTHSVVPALGSIGSQRSATRSDVSPASRILADSAASGTASTSVVPALFQSVAFRAAASTTNFSFSRVA